MMIRGDTMGDGRIDLIDILIAQMGIVSQITLTNEQQLRADANGDGQVNSIDLLMMARHLKGLRVIDEVIE